MNKKIIWVLIIVAILAIGVVITINLSGKDIGAPAPVSNNIKVINVSGNEFSFFPAQIKVNKGERVKIIFTNAGVYPHDWGVDEFGVRTPQVTPGQSAEVTFIADKTGTFQYYCSVDAHKDRGMTGTFTVQ